MKKYFYMAVAAIAALSSCSNNDEFEPSQTGKQALVFTATMEGSEGTRATYDSGNKCASWVEGDQISINGKTYNAQSAGLTTTFKADGEGATGTTYNAYFPADLYNGTTATLPAIQTYTAGKFNMPMYATSNTTTLKFYNLCAVLAIKVTNADITTLKSIKVASDKKMNGTFTVTDYKAVMGTDGTNAVELKSTTALTLDETGTTFYIAIPAQEYKYLNIFLSADGVTYTQAMATKKAAGLDDFARSKIFNIDYAKNATKLWAGNLFIADCNVGATAENIYGGLYTWGGTQNARVSYTDDHNTGIVNLTGEYDTATNLWGSNWRMPTKEELTTLKDLGALDDTNKGLLCTGQGDYSSNSVFLPAAGEYDYSQGTIVGQGDNGYYWSSTPYSNQTSSALATQNKYIYAAHSRSLGHSVRAVLEEAPATTGSAKRTGGVNVNWVQLWAGGPKFAEYNVGVTDGKAESYGGYYAWGGSRDMLGVTSDPVYIKGTDPLTDTSDTATRFWGSNWRMPTKAEFEALVSNCTFEWTQVNSVNGCKYTGKGAYASNSVFFPAAGTCNGGSVNYLGSRGVYWSSTPTPGDAAIYAMNLEFRSDYPDHQGVNSNPRHGVWSVRAVLNESAK